MMSAFDRVELLLGEENLKKLKNSSVAVFGIGGVGGYATEALARSGVGNITVFDNDVVAESNLNRQIIATVNALGQDKVAVMKDRLLSINPKLNFSGYKVFYLPENANEFDLSKFDYIIDAVDTVSAKIEIIMRAKNANVPVISCMGTGGKTDPTMLKVSDVSKTSGCPLARVMRRELKNRGIFGVKVVYSEERFESLGVALTDKTPTGKTVPPSMIFVPATAGLILAKEVVFDLIKR
ncbi:MAG: tRNA threonylcarbamoyladenosine dehydratase [Clostridia bacterium]|nr:tRNA threonylcarbamoyladenosine dehydratase [Clostridia bacterium]